MYFNYNIKNLKILNTIPYAIFEIPNFLTEESYSLLSKSFSSKEDLENLDSNFINNLKFSYNSSTDFYKKKLEINLSAKTFHNKVFSKEFISFFYNNFKPFFNLARKDDLLYLLKIKLRPKLFLTESSKQSWFKKVFFSKITPQIEYSYLMNNAKIVPHTDSRSKLISLMLYFPEEQLEPEISNSLGTTFYLSKDKNLKNKHLDNLNDQNEFKRNSKKLLTLPFNKKSLYGFVRSSNSWHTVEQFNISENFIRKSININLYM
tara:strand:- start:52112 stop:52897 length:786 start_codon:yes stop_codon:yes gene_type:complete